MDIMRTVLCLARSFKEEYKIAFCDARTSDVVSNMRSSSFFSKESKSTYARYARVGELMRTNASLLKTVMTLQGHTDRCCRLVVTHLDIAAMSAQREGTVQLLM